MTRGGKNETQTFLPVSKTRTSVTLTLLSSGSGKVGTQNLATRVQWLVCFPPSARHWCKVGRQNLSMCVQGTGVKWADRTCPRVCEALV